MRFLRSGAFVATIIVASISLLSCDFIDDDKVTPPIAVSFPSYQTIYGNGDRNRYVIESPIAGEIVMVWERNTFLPLTDPFTSAQTDLPLVKFTGTVTLGGVATSVTQYITQSTDPADEGSMFLHAFDDPLSPIEYWVAGDSSRSSLGSVQTIFSPYQIDAATSGEKDVTHTNDYTVMGSCTPTVCQAVANVSESFTVINQPLQVITIPALGEFETYRIIYSITVSPTNVPLLTSVLDYRTTCGVSDLTQTIIATGTLWVHPDIGPVRIQNQCSSVAVDPIDTITTGYSAVLSFTSKLF